MTKTTTIAELNETIAYLEGAISDTISEIRFFEDRAEELAKEIRRVANRTNLDTQELRQLINRHDTALGSVNYYQEWLAKYQSELNSAHGKLRRAERFIDVRDEDDDEQMHRIEAEMSELPISGEHPTAAEFNSIFPFIPLSHRRFLDKGGNSIDSALHQDAEVLRIEHEHGTDMVYVTLDVEPEAEFCFEDFEVVSRDEILAMDCNYNIEGERAYRLLRGTDSCIICYAQEHWIGEYIHWYYDANGEMVVDYLEDFFGDAPYKVCDKASAYAVKVAELIKAGEA